VPETETSAAYPNEPDIDGNAAMADPVRRMLYAYLGRRPRSASREEVARETGLAHHIVKFNLDRMVAEGLLDAEYRRPAGRGGPGAGRPAKLYRRSSREFSVSVPARRYELAARVLANAIRRTQESDIRIDDAVRVTAADAGYTLGRAAADRAGDGADGVVIRAAIREVLDEQGFATRDEEAPGGGIVVRFGNCPFAGLLRDCSNLICGMSHDLVTGLLDAAETSALRADSAVPAPGDCCISLSVVGDACT
jgi:predicted ArsR family transcriptional regulator